MHELQLEELAIRKRMKILAWGAGIFAFFLMHHLAMLAGVIDYYASIAYSI